MVKVRIVDDCFAPRRFKIVNYEGPDPFKFYGKGTELLKKIFEVSTSKTGEPRFMWDWTGDPVQLFSHRVARKPLSWFTVMWFSIRVVGFKYKTKNEGNFRMEVEAILDHGYKRENWFVRILLWIYWYAFYQKTRQMHLAMCQDYADRFIAKIKEMYDIKGTKEE